VGSLEWGLKLDPLVWGPPQLGLPCEGPLEWGPPCVGAPLCWGPLSGGTSSGGSLCVGALDWGPLDTLFCCLVSTKLEKKYCKRKQTARSSYSHWYPDGPGKGGFRVGWWGIGSQRGRCPIKYLWGTRRATSGGKGGGITYGRTYVHMYAMDSPIGHRPL
jgi:hypothetical protein